MDTQEKARILLVDDEPALVKLMQTYLSRMGYTVDTSGDADGAFAAFAQRTSRGSMRRCIAVSTTLGEALQRSIASD